MKNFLIIEVRKSVILMDFRIHNITNIFVVVLLVNFKTITHKCRKNNVIIHKNMLKADGRFWTEKSENKSLFSVQEEVQ